MTDISNLLHIRFFFRAFICLLFLLRWFFASFGLLRIARREERNWMFRSCCLQIFLFLFIKAGSWMRTVLFPLLLLLVWCAQLQQWVDSRNICSGQRIGTSGTMFNVVESNASDYRICEVPQPLIVKICAYFSFVYYFLWFFLYRICHVIQWVTRKMWFIC